MIRPGLLRSSREGAFEALYRRHVKAVYGYSLAMLDRQADAEDATQTTFMNAYRALERGERPRDAEKWLRSIALNVCREQYRRAHRRPDEVSLDEDPGDLVLDPPTPEIGDVLRGLSVLPFNQRAALVLREFEGRSLNEIASELDVTSSAVEALLFRARRALREQLEGSLTCMQAEEAISRQLDGGLPRAERGPLRAHLRECPECASLARRLRAQRRVVRSLALLPLPASLRIWRLGGTAAATTPAVAAGGSLLGKVAVVAVAGAATVGAGYAALHGHHTRLGRPAPAERVARVVVATPAATTREAVDRGQLLRQFSRHPQAATPGRGPARPGSLARTSLRPAGATPARGLARGSRAGNVAPGSAGHLAQSSGGHRSRSAGHSQGRSSVRPRRAPQGVGRSGGNATSKGKGKPSRAPAPRLRPLPLGARSSGKSTSGPLSAN